MMMHDDYYHYTIIPRGFVPTTPRLPTIYRICLPTMAPPETFNGHVVSRAMVTCNLRGRNTHTYLYKTPWSLGGYDDYGAWRVFSDHYPRFPIGNLALLQVRLGGRLVACVQTAQSATIDHEFRDTIGDAYDYCMGHFQLHIRQDSRRFVSILLQCGPYGSSDEYQASNIGSLWDFLQEVDVRYTQIMMISFFD